MSRKNVNKAAPATIQAAPATTFNVEQFAQEVAACTTLAQTQALAEQLGASGLPEAEFAVQDELLAARVTLIEAIAERVAPAPKAPSGQYGKRPLKAGKCQAVWEYLDEQLAKGNTPDSKLAKNAAAMFGWNTNNTVTEFYSWRKARSTQVNA